MHFSSLGVKARIEFATATWSSFPQFYVFQSNSQHSLGTCYYSLTDPRSAKLSRGNEAKLVLDFSYVREVTSMGECRMRPDVPEEIFNFTK